MTTLPIVGGLSNEVTVEITNTEPTIEVSKTPSPASVPETGGDVTFTYVVTNTTVGEPVTIDSLSDDVFGTLDGDADCKVGTVLAVDGGSCQFEVTVELSSLDLVDHENTFTAVADDDEDDGITATDQATATVTFIDALPDISIVKTANPDVGPGAGRRRRLHHRGDQRRPRAGDDHRARR